MNIEDQVTSLELSKKLKELKIEQDSVFYWVSYENEEKYWDLKYKEEIEWDEDIVNKYSAFLPDELMGLLNKTNFFINEISILNLIVGPCTCRIIASTLTEKIEYDSKNLSNSIALCLLSIIEKETL